MAATVDTHAAGAVPAAAAAAPVAGSGAIPAKTAGFDYSTYPGKDIPARDGMFFAHDAVRLDMAMFRRALERVDIKEDWHVENVAQWFATFAHNVHHHHANEEKVFIPWLNTKVLVPEKVSADHATLVSTLDGLTKDTAALANTGSLRKRAALMDKIKATWATFEPEMRAHLAEEEETLPHLMRLHFNLEEYQEMERHLIAEAGGPSALAIMLPWFLFPMGPEHADTKAAFLDKLPGFAKFALEKKWMPDYVRIVDLLRSIYDPSFIPPHLQSPAPTCWFCM